MGRIGINIATGSLQKEEIIVGIDLGTTHSLIAFVHPEEKRPVILKEHDKSSLVPSVIYLDELNNPIVGDRAKDHLVTDPARTIFSAKRLMGKSYADLKENTGNYAYRIIDDKKEGLVKVQAGDKIYSPVELSSFILKELKARAEHILKTTIRKAVITVPAYFNDSQRQATRDAGKLAGLDVLRIINEPTAASLAYGLNAIEKAGEGDSKVIAVYDLGGGTFDISILRIAGGMFEVLSTNGDTYLGGDDIDHAIVEHWIIKNGINKSELQQDKALSQSFRLQAEIAKKHLSGNDSWDATHAGFNLKLNRLELEGLVSALIERTITCCSLALKDAGLQKEQINEVVMVGGSTRIPFVKATVGSFFGKRVLDSVDPDEVVALGAALQAEILSGKNKDYLLLDITPLSLGIETSGGLMDVLIPRNSKIPAKTARQYTTLVDGQGGMRISVFQGERDLVRDNRKLAEFNLSGIPGMPAGLPKVEVGFLINADGILVVSAKELRSGVSQSIEVKPQYGLTDEEVEKILLESIHHAQDDILVRALTEAKMEGEQLLMTTEKFFQKNTEHLTQKEWEETAAAMQALQLSLSMDDKNLIHKKIEELNTISRPYAERVMDEAINKALSGKKI